MLKLEYSNDLCVEIQCVKSKNQPIELKFIGEKKTISVTWQSTFNAFKRSLQKFIDSIQLGQAPLSHQDMLRTVNLIELGTIYD